MQEVITEGFAMKSHISMENENASINHAKLSCENNVLNGQVLVKESHTTKRGFKFGKTRNTFYLNQNNSPMFNSLKEWCSHYKVTLVTGDDIIQPTDEKT